MKRKCDCPIYCRYCGRKRSRDSVGHYCKTHNCQWRHGYSECYGNRKLYAVSNREPTMKRTTKAVNECSKFLSLCLKMGWKKPELSMLEKTWWKHHDSRGEFRLPKPKVKVKP